MTALLLLLPGASDSHAQEQATPQRPSLGFNASTVPAGRFEVEAGGLITDDGSALPVFLKWGLTGKAELELGFEAVKEVDGLSGRTGSFGDLTLGVRTRLSEGASSAAALAAWVKVPTARDEVGSGESDLVAVGIWSAPAGPLTLDANLWISALGQPGGSTLVQVQPLLVLGFPIGRGWSGFGEVAWQKTASLDSGAFLDAGLAYQLDSRAILDFAAGIGSSGAYPDWTVTIGWTLLIGPESRAPAASARRSALGDRFFSTGQAAFTPSTGGASACYLNQPCLQE